jgi:hypothetical protein
VAVNVKSYGLTPSSDGGIVVNDQNGFR